MLVLRHVDTITIDTPVGSKSWTVGDTFKSITVVIHPSTAEITVEFTDGSQLAVYHRGNFTAMEAISNG